MPAVLPPETDDESKNKDGPSGRRSGERYGVPADSCFAVVGLAGRHNDKAGNSSSENENLGDYSGRKTCKEARKG